MKWERVGDGAALHRDLEDEIYVRCAATDTGSGCGQIVVSQDPAAWTDAPLRKPTVLIDTAAATNLVVTWPCAGSAFALLSSSIAHAVAARARGVRSWCVGDSKRLADERSWALAVAADASEATSTVIDGLARLDIEVRTADVLGAAAILETELPLLVFLGPQTPISLDALLSLGHVVVSQRAPVLVSHDFVTQPGGSAAPASGGPNLFDLAGDPDLRRWRRLAAAGTLDRLVRLNYRDALGAAIEEVSALHEAEVTLHSPAWRFLGARARSAEVSSLGALEEDNEAPAW